MVRTKADSYNKGAVKAPRKNCVFITKGQVSNVSAGSSKPMGQLRMENFFPKAGEPLVLKKIKKNKRVKKPEETAVASDEMVEGACSVDESEEKADPRENADKVISPAGPPSQEFNKIEYQDLNSIKFLLKKDKTLHGEDDFLLDDKSTNIIVDKEEFGNLSKFLFR